MREAYPAVASRQVVIPGGVDTARFRREPFAEAGRRLRLSLGLDEAYVGLLLARHPRLKGADAAVLALARPEVRSLTPPFHLWVAGGALPGGLRRRARRLGVAGRIRETGGTEDPRPLYAAADLLVHPTHYDPCSLVGLEALAMGLPVLTTAANGIVELMDGGRRGGALLEAATPEAVARGIVRFVDADRRRVAAEEARAVAVSNPLADRLDRLLAVCGARTS